MEQNPLISIIIPCYNDSQFVKQSVDSALNQTYSNKEVIVVDDGSDSITKIILKELEPKITKLITQENWGQSTARNVGIKEAKGEYILVLDSDDYLDLSFCNKAISVFLNNNDLKIVTCMATRWYENGKKNILIPSGGTILNFMSTNEALGTSMFKKVDWDLCGGYDENMRSGFEDWEFFIRILKEGGRAEVIQEPLYNYRRRSNSTTSIANSKKYQLLKYIYIKHQELYKDHFDLFVTHLLFKIEKEEIEKIKNTKRLEYIFGKALLAPIRWIKTLFT